MKNLKSEFLFATCQVGAEPALKKELARLRPDLKFAFARPGFLTFKQNLGKSLDPALDLGSIFARSYGVCLGRLPAGEEKARIAEARESLRTGEVHLWERDRHAPSEEPKGFDPRAIERKWAVSLMLRPSGERADAENAPVLDLIAIEEDELWMGTHLPGPAHAPFPGGRLWLDLPDKAPSRAYLKLEEAARVFAIPFEKGEKVLEIGSSPGGMTYALLARGLTVTGVDPGKMASLPRGLAANFQHFSRSWDAVDPEIVGKVDWLVIDMNVPPSVTLDALARFVRELPRGLQGALITFKLNHWRMADDLPKHLEAIRGEGFAQIRARQLFHNRQEITVYARSRRASIH